MEVTKSCGNIYKDFGFSDEEADKLTIKSELMLQIEKFIKRKGITHEQASKLMGVSRPRVSDVMRGKIDKFTIDALVDMLSKAGMHVSVTVEQEHAA